MYIFNINSDSSLSEYDSTEHCLDFPEINLSCFAFVFAVASDCFAVITDIKGLYIYIIIFSDKKTETAAKPESSVSDIDWNFLCGKDDDVNI